MSEVNGQKRVQKANMNARDIEYQSAKQALDEQKIAANNVITGVIQSEQENKGKHIFRSAKSRKALTNILATDLTTEKWINKKKGKRDTKKNIKAAYAKITGKDGLFGGLSRSDKATRKSEFETRRIQSLEASRAIADVAVQEDLGEGLDAEQMIASLANIDVSKYNLESDADFVGSFTQNMKELQRADMLLDYFQSEEGRELMGKNQELSMKLFWMRSIKDAYMERITVISSPYYVSMRDEDFTPQTLRRMENELSSNKKLSEADKSFYKAYLSSNKRKNGELRHDFDFRFDEQQKYPEYALKSRFYREARTNESMQKGMNEVADRDESGKLVEHFIGSTQCSKFRNGLVLTGGATPSWMRNYSDKPLTKEDLLTAVGKMKDKIHEFLTAEENYRKRIQDKFNWAVRQGSQQPINAMDAGLSESYRKQLMKEEFGEEPIHITGADRRQMEETRAILDNIIEKVNAGEISLDTARAWLDRTTGQLRLAGYLAEGTTLSRQEDEEYRKKQQKLSDEEKEEVLNKNIADLGSIVYKYSKNLGTFGYVSIRGSKDEKVQGSRFMHNDNLQHNKDFARLKHYRHEDLFGDFDTVCKNLGKDVGGVIRIRGGRFYNEKADSAYRVTISTNPEYKNESVEELLAYASEKHILNHLHINIRTGVDGPCNDDITIHFSAELSRENIKEFLDGYSKRCNEKNKDMLTDDDSLMPGTTTKYKDGISIAPQVPVDMMQWIKEETAELSQYNSKERLNTMNGEDVKKRLKEKKRPVHISYDNFIYEQMILSYHIAYERFYRLHNVLGESVNLAKLEVDHGLLKAEMKKVFKELMILNGIDPETMTSHRVKEEIEAEKKKGKKLSLSEVLDELEKKSKKEDE